MATVTASPKSRQSQPRKPRPKPARTARLFCYGDTALLVIRQQFSPTRGQLDTYRLEPIATDYGRGLLLFKEDGSSYCVNLSGPDSSCDCKGHEQHGHCKHVSALLALQQHGKL